MTTKKCLAAARLITGTNKTDHVSHILSSFHLFSLISEVQKLVEQIIIIFRYFPLSAVDSYTVDSLLHCLEFIFLVETLLGRPPREIIITTINMLLIKIVQIYNFLHTQVKLH